MTKCCICYTTDGAYLFPTFVSAVQAHAHSTAAKADVAIFSFGADPAAERDFAAACAAEGIRFMSVGLDQIEGAPAMLARLFLTRFVPAEYSQFLYIDGDTHITASLDPLIDASVPPGKFMATSDPMVFALPGNDAHARRITQHFASIGISPERSGSYFNTGVLRIARDGWEKIGQAAWALFRANPGGSRFPDQDVLNIVAGDQRIPMSLAWNFPIYMRNAGVVEKVRPRVTHFMSNPKPWHGVFLPWGPDSFAPYLAAIAKHPELARYRSQITLQRKARYQLQQLYKKVLETFTWRLTKRRGRILAYEAALSPLPATQSDGIIP
jgi:lipopolysaccharide biosynthesis glycosyltransferase